MLTSQDPFDSQSSFFEPATKLCLCEVEKSLVTVVLPSDRSVQVHCLLNGCVVEDARQGAISAFPRLKLYSDLLIECKIQRSLLNNDNNNQLYLTRVTRDSASTE